MKNIHFVTAIKVYVAVLMLFTCTAVVFSQTETARLSGSILDSNGAAVNGATINMVSDNGRTVTAVTDDNGNYSFLSLQPGKYSLEVSQSNFKTLKQEITVSVAQVLNLNFTLETGDVTETVVITSDAPLVDSSSSAIGAVIQGRQAVELPLNGRNVLELARLTPGVTQGVIGGFASGAGGNAETYRGGNAGGSAISVNGQRTQSNNYLLDGVDNNESLVNTINIFPSAEAVQEFRVQTSVATAEYGRGGGAIINSVTKSGTNSYHGSSYLFLRNNALDARPSFYDSEQNQRRLPLFRRSQFGGTFGGPVVIPGFGEGTPLLRSLKDKVFFFFSYDGLRQFLPRATETMTVPTEAFRRGDFSQLLNPASSGTNLIQLRDPLTGLDIPGNRIDLLGPGRMNAAAIAYLNAFPLPNNGSQVLQNYLSTRNEILDQNVYDVRVDANINDKNQMFVRGSLGTFDQTVESRLPALPAGFGSGSNPWRTRAIVAGLNTSVSSNVFNELRIQANRLKYGFEPPFGDQAISANLGIVNANRDSSLGGGTLIGGYGGQLEYTGDYGPYRVPQNTYQIVDSVSIVRGSHTFKLGGTILRREVELFRPIAGKGDFRMYGNGEFNQCPQGGGAAPTEAASGTTRFEQSDLLIGFMCTYDIGFQQGSVGTRNWENALFAQDDWKVTKRLTLNLGVRYELFTNPSEQYGRQANFDLTNGTLVLAEDKNDSLVETDKNNFSPRLGFAYDITGKGKSVIRGGYGLFYFLDRGGIDNQLAQNPPYSGSARYSYNDGYRITFTGQGPLNNNNNILATNALPLPQVSLDPAFLNNPVGVNVIVTKPDNDISEVQQFNVQYQHQLNNTTALSIGYVGTRGENLVTYYNLNGQALSSNTAIPCPINGRSLGSCYPGLGSVNVRDDIGRSRYDALQIQLEKRFSDGWQYITAYSFSKTKDNGMGAFDNNSGGINYIEQYGISRIDFPHVFSFATVYELPFGKGKAFGGNASRGLDQIIGGWQLNGIFRVQSGSTFDVRRNNVLVDVTGDPYTGQDTPYLDINAFDDPAAGTIGNLERNSLRSPSTYQLNLGLLKDFRFTERFKLQFRAEGFNILNTTQLGTPNTDLNNSNTFNGFGTIRGTSPYSNRQLQFGLRVEF